MDSLIVKPIVLVIENDRSYYNNFNQLTDTYTVIHSANSKQGFKLAKKCGPSLIILESSLSPIGGYELCRKFKSDETLAKIPIMFNIGSSEDFDPCFILELGAIDYMVSPINIDILKAKVNNFIRLYHSYIKLEKEVKSARELNPNTSLPGNTSIVTNIYTALNHDEPLILVYADLDNFKSYNDCYGFGKGDQMIQFTADTLQESLKQVKSFTFLGHIGGDDFVFIVPRSEIDAITSHIIKTFDKKIEQLYTKEDFGNGYIMSRSRQGQMVKHPIISLSMGGVDLSYYNKDTRFEEISDVCSEVKCFAKTFNGSIYCLDRRNNQVPANYVDIV
ncbi:MAG: diguanylate cyclase [Vallitaleaceae bacterium]|jgi:PleD family two-component response regulator|nr:diguanylate cyclase [Vallitaleaceae bacterium]